MKIFAIGDLHLSGSVNKPMDIFGSLWVNHSERIRKNWLDIVTDEDLVLLPGDFSWAMHLKDAEEDFSYLQKLPGKKLLIRGNHDYWWNSPSKIRAVLPASVDILQNERRSIGDVHIAGTRGWVCPGSAHFNQEDQKLYQRELGRLSLSLSDMPASGLKIVMLHYPPFNDKWESSGFVEQCHEAGIDILLYAHLHGRACRGAFEGERDGITYHLVSADHIGFAPKWIASV